MSQFNTFDSVKSNRLNTYLACANLSEFIGTEPCSPASNDCRDASRSVNCIYSSDQDGLREKQPMAVLAIPKRWDEGSSGNARASRSEEHTSELQSRFGISYAV